MTRNLKALGLALCAVFVFSAVAASGASAGDKFTAAGVSSAWLHGVQVGEVGNGDNEFNTKSVNLPVTCENATFANTPGSTVSSGAELAVVHPEYSGCHALGQPATVDTEGCDFRLTGTTESHPKTTTGTETDATVGLECETGKSIKVTATGGCTITMAAAQNSSLLGVTYANEGSGSTADVKVHVTVDSIHYTSNFACQLVGFSSTNTDAYLTQTVTVKGYAADSTTSTQVGVSTS